MPFFSITIIIAIMMPRIILVLPLLFLYLSASRLGLTAYGPRSLALSHA